MPDDMRAKLEADAKKRSWSLTQELLWRVQDSFNQERDKRRDSALRALNFVIAQIAERVSGGIYVPYDEFRQELLKEWRTDPFKFKAFKFAVVKLLDHLQPAGEIRPAVGEAAEQFGITSELAKLIAATNETPEAYGAFVFGALWAQLTRSTALTEKERGMSHRFPYFGKVVEREFYGFANARRDLQISTTEEKKP
jgi:hypothetical protein